jgi:hypothetical protein
MNKKLEIALGLNPGKLVPSKTFKSDLVLLDKKEFDLLHSHINSEMNKHEWDTIIIANTIFKKRSLTQERKLKLKSLKGTD